MLSTETRNELIKRLAAKPGASPTRIARMFGLSRQMVQRIVGGNRKGATGRTRTGPRPETRRNDHEEIFRFVVQFKAEHDGCSPTYREIATANGCTISGADYAIRSLAKAGRVTIKNGRICCGHWTLEEVS